MKRMDSFFPTLAKRALLNQNNLVILWKLSPLQVYISRCVWLFVWAHGQKQAKGLKKQRRDFAWPMRTAFLPPPDKPGNHTLRELPLSDGTVCTKSVFTGHALASSHLKEIKCWCQASGAVVWIMLKTWLSSQVPLYHLLHLKSSQQLAGPFKN